MNLKNSRQTNNVNTMTKENVKPTKQSSEISKKKLQEKENEIILIDFYAEWCSPCKMQDPIIEELKEKFGEKIKFKKIDIDKNEQFANKFRVMAIPTIIIQKNCEVVNKFVGVTSKKVLENELNNLLKNIY